MTPATGTIDDIDVAIVGALQANARVSNKDLARAVGLSASACLMRVRRLEMRGVIAGYAAKVDLSSLGETIELYAWIVASDHTPSSLGDCVDVLSRSPLVAEMHEVIGLADLLVHVISPGLSPWIRLEAAVLAAAGPETRIRSAIVTRAIKNQPITLQAFLNHT